MKIAIIGYGKMGKEIEAMARKFNLTISRIVEGKDDLSKISFGSDEVAVEFTTPDACLGNISTLLKKKVPVVCGTTGWTKNIFNVKDWVREHHGAFLHSSNFSIGVHVFWKTLEQLSKTMNFLKDYNAYVVETHHTSKKDQPSGTAKISAEIIQKNMTRPNIDIQSIRKDDVVGEHQIFFESPQDVIELNHRAKDRSGFAAGAIECAKWLQKKKGFFTIDDYLKEKLL